MATYPVRVRWGKNRYDLEVDTSEIPVVFKAQLMTITDVPMERQKIISHGHILNDDSWDEFPIKQNILLTLVGTSDSVPATCSENNRAMAGMIAAGSNLSESALNMDSESTKLKNGEEMDDIPLGFYNYGNTCFVNSVIQFIKRISPLRKYFLNLPTLSKETSMDVKERIVYAFRKVILHSEVNLNNEQLDYDMKEFLQLIDRQFPEFAEVNNFGIRKQHDSSEFFGKVINVMKQHMQNTKLDVPENSSYDNVLDTFMRVEFQQEISLRDSGSTKGEISTVSDYMIQCVIDSSVREIVTGLKLGLEDVIERYNDDLKKNCEYTKILRFSRLPEYLVVNLGRFHFKTKQNLTAKIVKEIKFPMNLDLYNFCSEEYKQQLTVMRDALSSHRQLKNFNLDNSSDSNSPKMDSVISLEQQALAAGTSGSALYNLKAIITHRGRTSTEGHYVCWLKLKNRYWVKMDDNEVVIVTTDEIFKLWGGGDWHMAYNLLYECEKFPPE